MKNILIIPNTQKDRDFSVSSKVASVLKSYGISVFVEERYNTDLGGIAKAIASIDDRIELIIVIGGDGSVIDASVPAVSHGIPVLGVNLGHLGYLAEVELSNLGALEKLTRGEYVIEEKMLLSVTATDDGELIQSARFAVNDVIISHESYVGLAELKMRVNDGESVKYRADGLILSTPVGSTAYSLSAGGPIIAHDIDSIAATPICPHSLYSRAVILPQEAKMSVKIGKPQPQYGKKPDVEAYLTVDGGEAISVANGETIVISRSELCARFISFDKDGFYDRLKNKFME
ncbi:MAG: NAD(+)/NADH kinase [Clostridia bacterium]|nr:NAD(+)/NADH kinase [Clostridia bacterium]